jgi:thiamine biosynthesis lipoprotein
MYNIKSILPLRRIEVKRLSKITAVFLCCLSLLFSLSCKEPQSSRDLFFFNTNVHIQTVGSVVSEETIEKLESLFSSLENEFSISKENSLTCKFNLAKSGEIFPLSDTAIDVLSLTKEAHSFTGGKFDPSVFPLVKLWKFYPEYPVANFTVPTDESIETILSSGAIDFSSAILDKDAKTLTKTNDFTQLDLGGILKGYALDKAAEILRADGHSKGYLSIGSSSLYVLGSKMLGIKHPRGNADLPLIVSVDMKDLNNLAVSTSGDYEKFYRIEEDRYSHIINPKTGRPSQTGIVSATVIGENGGMLDAISTALCLCSFDEENKSGELVDTMREIEKKYPSIKIFVAYRGEKQYLLTNQERDKEFFLIDESYRLVNI